MASKPFLTPFLQRFQAPRILPYRQCMRISSSRPLQTEASTDTPSPTLRTETYHVSRTPSHQLPIYLLAKRGGNLHQTRVKKIEGDIGALRKQLQQALVIDEADIRINQLTRHIIIKGWRKPEVAKFLEEKRF